MLFLPSPSVPLPQGEGGQGACCFYPHQQFTVADIPYDKMWPDDCFWLPLVLAGSDFEAKFNLLDKDTILEHKVTEIKK